MADENRARTAKVILLSAAGLAVMALGAWVGMPPTQPGRGLIATVLAAAAVVDASLGLFLLTRS